MAKVYIYKVTVDAGGAPCVRDDVLSLAICKPAIRSTAQVDNVILGFAANRLHKDNRLIYAAIVTRHIDGRKYFGDAAYSSRPDCIYHWDGHRFQWKPNSKFHSRSDLTHDLGEEPDYNRANVLLSGGRKKFRYFGGDYPLNYKSEYPRLKLLVEGLGPGHRVNFGSELQVELSRFIKQVWDATSAYRETPMPDAPCQDKCSDDDEGYATGEC